MTDDTFRRLDDEFVRFPVMRALDVPTSLEIEAAARKLGVPFAKDYQQFLSRFGGAMVGPFPIYGLRPVEVIGTSFWSVVDVTLSFRESGIPIFSSWVVVSMDQSGNPIGMDTSGRLWLYDHDTRDYHLVADTFESYLRRSCLKVPE